MVFSYLFGGCVFALRNVLMGWTACAAAGLAIGWSPAPQTRLDFLSVGQGDCAVFQTAGNVVLIDAGPKSETFDSGKKIVLPTLDKIGVWGVDLIVITHPDIDHVGGVGALHRAFPKARLAISDQFRTYPAMVQLLQEWRVPDKNVAWLGATSSIRVGEFTLSIKSPELHRRSNDNEGSLFIHLVGRAGSAVFSGDAGSTTEAKMEPLADWSAQVLKIGHHGSKNSTSPSWIMEVQPKYAVVSCGLNNMYGHPAPKVLSRLEAAGVPVYRTDLQGDIRFDYDEKNGFVPSG
jgi:competence protein ComEC